MLKVKGWRSRRDGAAALTAAICLSLALPTGAARIQARHFRGVPDLPPAPTHLHLAPGNGTVTLTWDPNAATDPAFIGYQLFRRIQRSGYSNITPRSQDGGLRVLTTNSFTDHGRRTVEHTLTV